VTAVVVMGVAGSGKSTVGQALADRLGATFVEGDDYHSPEALAAMSAGRALTDEDRAPWLARLHREVVAHAAGGVVLACSALTERARTQLTDGITDVHIVWLTGEPELIETRLTGRIGQPVGAALLPSQLATLEPPHGALALDVADPPDLLVERIVSWLAAAGGR
jgi:gluconokinase